MISFNLKINRNIYKYIYIYIEIIFKNTISFEFILKIQFVKILFSKIRFANFAILVTTLILKLI